MNKRARPSWLKFMVDDKELFVYPKSRVPVSIRKMAIFKGIELIEATKEERAPYLRKEI